jgi:two-component system LytT family response regulator
MARIRTLIVDDEPLAREGLRQLLESDPEIEILAECGDGPATLEAVRQYQPDLMFLDIQMPEMNGFEVLQALEETVMPLVVFVTAFEEHAIHAFQVHALDYLLKPIEPDRFREALARVKEEIQHRDGRAVVSRILGMLGTVRSTRAGLDRIMLKNGGKISFVRSDEIDWVEAQGDYVCLHVHDRKHLIREKISALDEQLPRAQFVRIHRSTIVNINRIKELQPLYHGDYAVLLQDGTRLTLSRSFRERAFQELSMTP